MVPGSAYGCRIDKFPFATDSNATDIGDLTEPKFQSNGFIN